MDETGLTGRYDIELTFKTTVMENGRNRVHVEALPAVLKSLGLELKPITGDMPVYTIQAAHMPTPN